MPAPYKTDDYLGLITSEYAGQPDFAVMVANFLQLPVVLQAEFERMFTLFDIDSATGAQLDAIGLWLNRSRLISTPLTGIYFSFDTPGLGFDEGVWQNPLSPSAGLTSLDDDHYRLLLRAKIASNTWDGTLPDAIKVLSTLIQEPIADPAQTLVFMQDNDIGQAWIGLSGKLPTALAIALITGGYISLRAMGVKLRFAITSVDQAPLFGFDMDNQYIAGFDTGAWGTLSQSPNP